MRPLLFSFNDIVNATSILELILLADDTTLFSHPDITSQTDTINKELEEIGKWFQANKISINASKTNYMVLGTHYNTRNANVNHIKLHGESLNRVSTTKFLGVIIDKNLTWKIHIGSISKTLSRNTGMLTKIKHFVPEKILYY